MPGTFAQFEASGDILSVRLTADELGFTPERVWNPSPSRTHRTEPYPVPQALQIGIQGNQETGAKFSPPPFAVEVEGNGGARTLLCVAADAGWHRWNEVVFETQTDGVTCTIDLEGHTSPAEAAEHVRLMLLPAEAGESRHELLARGLRAGYPEAFRPVDSAPEWWAKPIYCGWGDQVSTSMWLEGPGPEARALAYCLQGLHERWLGRLDEAEAPVGSIIIASGTINGK